MGRSIARQQKAKTVQKCLLNILRFSLVIPWIVILFFLSHPLKANAFSFALGKKAISVSRSTRGPGDFAPWPTEGAQV